jgi:hypothetical protein
MVDEHSEARALLPHNEVTEVDEPRLDSRTRCQSTNRISSEMDFLTCALTRTSFHFYSTVLNKAAIKVHLNLVRLFQFSLKL